MAWVAGRGVAGVAGVRAARASEQAFAEAVDQLSQALPKLILVCVDLAP